MERVRWLKNISRKDVGSVGNLAAHMGEVSSSLMVPPGFVLTNVAMEDFLLSANLRSLINEKLEAIEADPDQLNSLSQDIQKAILGSKFPWEIEIEFVGAVHKVGQEITGSKKAIVRLSLIVEKKQNLSLAHVLPSTVSPWNEKDALASVIRGYSSSFSPAIIRALLSRGIELKRLSAGVLVQQMIQPKVSGVISLKGNKEEGFLIKATPGVFMAGMRKGSIPQEYEVDRNTGDHSGFKSGSWSNAYTIGKDGEPEAESYSQSSTGRLLSNENLVELSRICNVASNIYKTPFELEWCLTDQGKIFTVNVRPYVILMNDLLEVKEERLTISHLAQEIRGMETDPENEMASFDEGSDEPSQVKVIRPPDYHEESGLQEKVEQEQPAEEEENAAPFFSDMPLFAFQDTPTTQETAEDSNNDIDKKEEYELDEKQSVEPAWGDGDSFLKFPIPPVASRIAFHLKNREAMSEFLSLSLPGYSFDGVYLPLPKRTGFFNKDILTEVRRTVEKYPKVDMTFFLDEGMNRDINNDPKKCEKYIDEMRSLVKDRNLKRLGIRMNGAVNYLKIMEWFRHCKIEAGLEFTKLDHLAVPFLSNNEEVKYSLNFEEIIKDVQNRGLKKSLAIEAIKQLLSKLDQNTIHNWDVILPSDTKKYAIFMQDFLIRSGVRLVLSPMNSKQLKEILFRLSKWEGRVLLEKLRK